MFNTYLKYKDDILSSLFALLLLGCALVINAYAVAYTSREASNSVTDLVLSNTPAFDVESIYLYGPLIVFVFVLYVFIRHPRSIAFTLKSAALFVFVRSIFISLTHMSIFPVHAEVPTTGIAGYFESLSDLFFSGHTGLPFLLALIYWYPLWLRIIFIAVSIFFGIIVLLGHLHYSIDVLAAFFISYGIYHMAGYIFASDKVRSYWPTL
ncbi:hypothetical protein HY090_00615 [Candidatus Kaiserbacteria bacterium]|nr:hypothetical protein [Candidatus Kaiserbacteria bacterium]